MAFAGCGGGPAPEPEPEPARTPMPAQRLPVPQSAGYLREVLHDCMSREGLTPVELEGAAPIVRDAGAEAAGGVMIVQPAGAILHVVHTPAQARAVVRETDHLELRRRGRVVYEPGELKTPFLRRLVRDCIDEAERAAQSG